MLFSDDVRGWRETEYMAAATLKRAMINGPAIIKIEEIILYNLKSSTHYSEKYYNCKYFCTATHCFGQSDAIFNHFIQLNIICLCILSRMAMILLVHFENLSICC